MASVGGEALHRVLVVDDSAVVRQIMRAILSDDGRFEVATAADPLIAMAKMERVRPDVILLDVEMPRMDGLTFLRKLMGEDPIPVVICSVVAQRGTEAALAALAEGAVDVVAKPEIGVAEFLRDSAVMLADSVHAAAHARVGALASVPARRTVPFQPAAGAIPLAPPHALVAVGASTGGPEALKALLASLPKEAPGLVIVQHMPEHFTGTFARRLDGECEIEVREAADGDSVRPGLALIARGNHHLTVHRSRESYAVAVTGGDLVSRHRPSVDVLFRSVAKAAGAGGLGILLTGMGNDGAEGLWEMRNAGAATVAQDETSSVVFGMPREAIARGGVETVAPLSDIPAVLVEWACERSATLPRS